MSRSNVNPNHYKVAGRERQGEDIPQIRNKQKHAEGLVVARRASHARITTATTTAPRPAAASPKPATKKATQKSSPTKASTRKATKHPANKARAATSKG